MRQPFTQRKASLLVEYKALKKANAFVDRRFGEQDDSLSAEDKALLRYQKQRTRELGRTWWPQHTCTCCACAC